MLHDAQGPFEKHRSLSGGGRPGYGRLPKQGVPYRHPAAAAAGFGQRLSGNLYRIHRRFCQPHDHRRFLRYAGYHHLSSDHRRLRQSRGRGHGRSAAVHHTGNVRRTEVLSGGQNRRHPHGQGLPGTHAHRGAQRYRSPHRFMRAGCLFCDYDVPVRTHWGAVPHLGLQVHSPHL